MKNIYILIGLLSINFYCFASTGEQDTSSNRYQQKKLQYFDDICYSFGVRMNDIKPRMFEVILDDLMEIGDDDYITDSELEILQEINLILKDG